MSGLICEKCGGSTNSATANWTVPTVRLDNKAYECFARVERGFWVKGCAFEKADPWMRDFLSRLIGTEDISKDPMVMIRSLTEFEKIKEN